MGAQNTTGQKSLFNHIGNLLHLSPNRGRPTTGLTGVPAAFGGFAPGPSSVVTAPLVCPPSVINLPIPSVPVQNAAIHTPATPTTVNGATVLMALTQSGSVTSGQAPNTRPAAAAAALAVSSVAQEDEDDVADPNATDTEDGVIAYANADGSAGKEDAGPESADEEDDADSVSADDVVSTTADAKKDDPWKNMRLTSEEGQGWDNQNPELYAALVHYVDNLRPSKRMPLAGFIRDHKELIMEKYPQMEFLDKCATKVKQHIRRYAKRIQENKQKNSSQIALAQKAVLDAVVHTDAVNGSATALAVVGSEETMKPPKRRPGRPRKNRALDVAVAVPTMAASSVSASLPAITSSAVMSDDSQEQAKKRRHEELSIGTEFFNTTASVPASAAASMARPAAAAGGTHANHLVVEVVEPLAKRQKTLDAEGKAEGSVQGLPLPPLPVPSASVATETQSVSNSLPADGKISFQTLNLKAVMGLDHLSMDVRRFAELRAIGEWKHRTQMLIDVGRRIVEASQELAKMGQCLIDVRYKFDDDQGPDD
jgi:hypothetical protein